MGGAYKAARECSARLRRLWIMTATAVPVQVPLFMSGHVVPSADTSF
jgi:hypothetical protein